MGQVIEINGDYTIKAKRPGGAHITLDTGPGGSVSVTGDLQVAGTTQTFNSQVISDVILVLNRGETGAGVTLRRSGIEIDRGSLDRADFLFDENNDSWTITNKLNDGSYSFLNSNLQLRRILTDAGTDNGDLSLINTGTGVVKVPNTTDYENRVIDHSRLPSVVITHISRSAGEITVTTATTHGLGINDFVDIHCATFPAFNATNRMIISKTDTTFKYASAGADFTNTPVSGYVIKNSLVWNGSPTDDYIPNMRAVSDYSRSLVNAAIENFSTSHIEDQNSSVLVYDSDTAGGTSYVKVTIDGIEKISVVGAGITTPATTFDLLNSNAATVNFAGAGTLINVGSGTPGTTTHLKNATINVGNGSSSAITTPSANFDLINTNATTINFAGAGTTINIGSATTGTTTNLKNATVSIGNTSGAASITTPSTTFNLVNDTATTVNFAGAANVVKIGNTTGSGATWLHSDIVSIGTGTAARLTTPGLSFSLLDSVTDLSVGLSATTLNIGATTGNANIRNTVLTIGTAAAPKTTIATASIACDLINTDAKTVNFAGAGTLINIGSDAVSTTTNLKNATVKIGNGTTSSITTPATTFNLINTVATTVKFAGAGTDISIGSALPGKTTINHDLTVTGELKAAGITANSTGVTVSSGVTFSGTVSGIDISMISGGLSYNDVLTMIAQAIAAIP